MSKTRRRHIGQRTQRKAWRTAPAGDYVAILRPPDWTCVALFTAKQWARARYRFRIVSQGAA